MTDPAEREKITVTEFGARVGVDPKQVRRWIASGKLAKDGAGRLDAAVVPAWREMHSAAKFTADPRSSKRARTPPGHPPDSAPDTTPEQRAAEVLLRGEGMSYQEARRQREMYQAQLLRVQYDLQSGEVVRVADVARMLGEQCARIRTKLLAIPSSCAARVARMTTPAEVDAALSAAIVDALRELTADQVP